MKLTSDNKSCEDAFEAGKKVVWIKRGLFRCCDDDDPSPWKSFQEYISRKFFVRKKIRITEGLLRKFCPGPRATSRWSCLLTFYLYDVTSKLLRVFKTVTKYLNNYLVRSDIIFVK
jgi:hypothetical protein